jgi:hypothetical protein
VLVLHWSTTPWIKWTEASRITSSFQDANQGPIRSRLNDTVGSDASMTFAKVSPLCRTILYNTGYCSRRGVEPNHLSSQNHISDPSLIEKYPYWKKVFFYRHNASPKCESPDFQIICEIAFEPTYFLRNNLCHTPSSVNNLTSHFPSKAPFLTSRSWTTSPPCSFGRQMTLHLVNMYFFFFTISLPKEF